MFCFVLPSVFQVGDRLSLSPPVFPSWGPQLLHSGKSTPPCSPPPLFYLHMFSRFTLCFFLLPPPLNCFALLSESIFLPSTRLTTAHSLGSPSPSATWISTWLPQQDRLTASALPHYNLPRTLAFEEAASRWAGRPGRMHFPCCTALLCTALWFSYAGKGML